MRQNIILSNPARMVDAAIARHPALLLPGMSSKVRTAADFRALDRQQPDMANSGKEGSVGPSREQ
jgi:hypothetical protein